MVKGISLPVAAPRNEAALSSTFSEIAGCSVEGVVFELLEELEPSRKHPLNKAIEAIKGAFIRCLIVFVRDMVILLNAWAEDRNNYSDRA
ncbi:hypothetical protein ABWH88_01840 [Marinobacter adhaerens]|jgi:hypothetical protein|uniref:Uncharacterized protein n=2 Tax=Marinobacter adhaerens TaxID=1033846 RepID=A0ABX8ICD9_9GAMM|nr:MULTISPECIES: hypothetical protein [Marinobacter]ADP97359.1 hypothetical protein HP15_1595 [Marinobacter adhaerens HP15]MBW4978683.1 hypothetical protein [Marinobacter adhaerens]QWV11451.1 hypothetical protein KQ249_12150 [Marinobacter adhaerens]